MEKLIEEDVKEEQGRDGVKSKEKMDGRRRKSKEKME